MAGYQNQPDNSIIINAAGNTLYGTTFGLFISPIEALQIMNLVIWKSWNN